MWRLASRDVSTSPGGNFELERFVGQWDDGDETGSWWVLRERATGAVRLDTSKIKKGSVRWAPDGGLLVRLQGIGNARVFRAEPDRGTFRDLALQEAPQPIEALQAAVDRAAREVGADGRPLEPPYDFMERDFSPDGSLLFEFFVQEIRMSHQVRTPRLSETATGRELLNMADTLFDGSVTWRGENGIDLYLRHYARPGGLAVSIDPARGVFSFPYEGDRQFPIERLQAETERAFDRASDRAEKAARRHENAQGPNPPIEWGHLLLILVLAVFLLVAIIGVTLWTSGRGLPPLPSFTGR